MDNQYILILGAGLMQKPAIESAKELGYKTLVLDANPDAVCVPFADRFEQIDLKDSQKIADFAFSLGNKLKAVFTAGTDFSSSVSLAAEKCNLISHSYESALNASNKFLMRECFKKNNIPSPDFFSVDENYILNINNDIIKRINFPKVVKPVDNMGARGCRLVRNESEYIPALKEALKYSRSKKVIVEDYMDGPEFSIDALVVNKKVIITGFADRHIYFKPYFIELGHTMPTEISDDIKAELVQTFTNAVHALGLTNGVAKGDVKYTKVGAMIGEIAARLSGGYMSGWTFPYSSDVNLTKEALKISLGCPSDYSNVTEIKSTKFSHERAFISIPGKVKKIYGRDISFACPFIKNVFFRIQENSIVDFPRNNVEKCGNVISCSEKRELSLNSAESAVSQIVLRLYPENKQTEDFLNFIELPNEKGFPYSAYEIDLNSKTLQKELDLLSEIKENDSVKNYIPNEIQKHIEKKDWNYRTIKQTLDLFDKINPSHPCLNASKFWTCLIRGGIQGILYYSDCVECKNEK